MSAQLEEHGYRRLAALDKGGRGEGGVGVHVTDAPFRSLHFGRSRSAERKVRILKGRNEAVGRCTAKISRKAERSDWFLTRNNDGKYRRAG